MAQTRRNAESEQRGLEDAALDALIGEGMESTNPMELEPVFRQLQNRLAEPILAGELTERLGYAPGEAIETAVLRNSKSSIFASELLTAYSLHPQRLTTFRVEEVQPLRIKHQLHLAASRW